MIIEYQALNRSGHLVSDTLTVDELPQAYTELNRRGLTPVRIGQNNKKTGRQNLLVEWLSNVKNGMNQVDPRKASKKEVPFFTTQMAIMLETGTTVADTLGAIEKQMTCPHWRMLAGELLQHVTQGGTLASAIAMYPQVFDEIYISMISAGEASGQLSVLLRRLADFSHQADRIRNKIIAAMIYPTLLLSIAGSVVLVLIFFVLPRFEAIFTEMNVTIPATTQTMLTISHFVREHIFLTILSIAAVSFA